ncbi:MAG: peptide-methionine (R)-S-oxide reductase MsrB [Helicobacteraceae bacterium]|nr:peptide-methionine (R)-S-oxide reductase MsrB [Helicobacteraceae bacterium]
MSTKISKTPQEWKAQLSPLAYQVCREHGTEAPFSGEFYHHSEDGIYRCVCCDAPLFESYTKFDSGTGWPSYYESIEDAITEIKDISHGMIRTEVRCSTCDAHLGHVFPDGPEPTGLRYCINSVCLTFEESEES